jgi:hypothetical protein
MNEDAARSRGSRRRLRRAAGAVVVGLAGLAGLAASTGPAGAAAPKAAPAPTWADYFYPLTVGWTCHESLHSGGVTGSETLRVDSVERVAGGQEVTIDEGSSTTVNGTTVPTNASLHYVLTNGGQLVLKPSAGQFIGETGQLRGDTTYPSVRALLGGGASDSSLQVGVPLGQSDLSQLHGALLPGSTSLVMDVVLRLSGTPVAVLQTPMGTYHHVLAVHSTLKAVVVADAIKGVRKEFGSQIRPLIQKELDNTTWYAPGVGPIKFSLGGITSEISSCGTS